MKTLDQFVLEAGPLDPGKNSFDEQAMLSGVRAVGRAVTSPRAIAGATVVGADALERGAGIQPKNVIGSSGEQVALAAAGKGADLGQRAVRARMPRSADTTMVRKVGSKAVGVAKFVGGKAALPIAAGLAAYDAIRGYNANPNQSTSQRLKDAGRNALSGFTMGAVKPPKGIKEDKYLIDNNRRTTMKTLRNFMQEALDIEGQLLDEKVVVGNVTNGDIFVAIADSVGEDKLSERQLQEVYNLVVQKLSSQLGVDHIDDSAYNVDSLEEEADIELKPHPTKSTHYIVHKISKGSGIESDQLKHGEHISDTHVDDLQDMGYKLKIHDK